MPCALRSLTMPPKPPSLRALLLTQLATLPTGERRCTVQDAAAKCNAFLFSASSDSAAWRNHFASFHPAVLADLLSQAGRPSSGDKRSATAAGLLDDDDDGVSSVAPVSLPESAAAASSSSASNSIGSPRPSSSSRSKRPRTQESPLAAAFSKQNSKTALQLLAVAFASNSIAYSVVEDEDFRAFLRSVNFGALPSRELIRATTLSTAAAVREQIEQKIRGAIVTVAVDGWTNVKREKVTNVVLMLNGQALYWCSIINREENTAVWLAAQLLVVIRSLINTYKARVTGVVVDNEAVNGAAHKILLAELPFLLHIPCAAHTIQLVVRSCLELPQLKPTVEELSALIRFFDAKENRIALRRIQEARELKTLRVLKSCDTRWHSLLMASERMLQIQKEVLTCYDAESLPGVPADFFPRLQQLVDFLKPFLVATDRIQRDTATLLTVHDAFQQLRLHGEKHASWALPCLQARWEKRVHVEAVTAVALLSFQKPSDPRAALHFIVRFGAHYIAHYSLSEEQMEHQQLEDALRSQLADFNGRAGQFRELDVEIQSMQRRAGNGVWDPRKIWWLHPGLQLSTVALALLSCSASEAAVERTFSAQGLLHSKRRNALNNDAVQAEMMMKFNRRVLNGQTVPAPIGCIEMHEDATPDDENAATVVPEGVEEGERESLSIEDDEVEEMKDSDADPEPPVNSARQRALRRAESLTFDNESSFLEWFIHELQLTKDSRINADVSITLEALSRKFPGTPGTATLLQHLREKLKV